MVNGREAEDRESASEQLECALGLLVVQRHLVLLAEGTIPGATGEVTDGIDFTANFSHALPSARLSSPKAVSEELRVANRGRGFAGLIRATEKNSGSGVGFRPV